MTLRTTVTTNFGKEVEIMSFLRMRKNMAKKEKCLRLRPHFHFVEPVTASETGRLFLCCLSYDGDRPHQRLTVIDEHLSELI